ncbi:hypothetical protein MKZ38_005936 [Zalerion maritima]|uniref:DUF7598 domain-containing protein n=1 Tax=Zalerion maritima TaxID=339359 RepID=A0AAD5RWP8_9PEZI|nr:hypothetical protein MKZ38_005936 [Zalerion maritima]
MAFPVFALFKIGKKVAEHTGFIEAPDRNRPKKSAWIVLQILRIFSIFVLVGVAVAEWCMIVKDGVPEAFFVFHAVVHAFVSFFVIFLILAECGLFKGYFYDNWPLLSDSHGLSWLGLIMIMLGCKMLGNLTEDANSQENLTMPIWRAVLAAGILSIIFGFFNIICSFVYKTPMYTSREVRCFGSKLDGKNSAKDYDFETSTHRTTSVRSEKQPAWKRLTRPFVGHGKKPSISAPMPADDAHYGSDVESGYDDRQPDPRGSPIAPGVVRPPTALHPANRYSEASYINRF